jgi:hypothetical protein
MTNKDNLGIDAVFAMAVAQGKGFSSCHPEESR